MIAVYLMYDSNATQRGLMVELATIYTLTIQDVFMAVQSKGTSLRSVVSVILHHKNLDNSQVTRPLFCVLPNRAGIN